MKNSKATPQRSAQEECGIWLDTVQLKEKAKKKRHARPISKLLNPLAKGGGYSLAVALNFTQTKMEMPKTKQSSISAFFSPKHRVLHKMSSVQAPSLDLGQPSMPSTTTRPVTVSSVKKRARENCSENLDLESDAGMDDNLEKENVAETNTTTWRNERTHYSSSLDGKSAEYRPPQCKRRLLEPSLLDDESQIAPQPWSQDPMFTFSEYSEDVSSSGSNFINNTPNSEIFGNFKEGTTSTQKPETENSFHLKDGKENSRLISSKSPSKYISLSHAGAWSNHKWAEVKNASPRKQTDHLGSSVVKELHFDSLWRNKRSSPLKKQQKCREADENSLAMLFTQDSEGFRVIAHRGLQTRSPLKDQSNLSPGLVRNYKPVEEEEDEDEEMLFTQDSQGNMVIKH
ncbi:aurora kinase A and ninein-interacting protein isoform X1 [Poeciliopsis prolifica]|uniref:aurora kinase A and ninein-interacting protein isoform X1 n=1 Tax=Poeciliopsis prolifica TaxID=188132 RepID=UPI002413872F|nr:aurora kinase A and ninein-interacting protein isoform X1 [Poeciliopsis prolifica]XP_054910043.1 aurora kinase A and ninein-interacting protein isoform X1 [Poeciliopsis prolifica]